MKSKTYHDLDGRVFKSREAKLEHALIDLQAQKESLVRAINGLLTAESGQEPLAREELKKAVARARAARYV